MGRQARRRGLDTVRIFTAPFTVPARGEWRGDGCLDGVDLFKPNGHVLWWFGR